MDLELHLSLMNYTILEAEKRKPVTLEEAEQACLGRIFGEHADDLPYDWRGKKETSA